MDIFIGGAGDDLTWLGLGVVAHYARSHASRTGRPTIYSPHGRDGRLRRLVRLAARRGEPVCLIGHSWGGPDAWRAAAWAAARELPIQALITLDPVGGPVRRRFAASMRTPWLNVEARPSRPDRSDRLTQVPGLSRKPSGLPVDASTRFVVVDLNHWDVAGMLAQGDAWPWVESLAAGR